MGPAGSAKTTRQSSFKQVTKQATVKYVWLAIRQVRFKSGLQPVVILIILYTVDKHLYIAEYVFVCLSYLNPYTAYT